MGDVSHKTINMSEVGGEIIVARNLRLKENGRPMVVIGIIRYAPTKTGGKGRYRFAGYDNDHTSDNMSVFTSKEKAELAAIELGISIEKGVAKTRQAKKSCKQIGIDAEERCDARRIKPSTKPKKGGRGMK